MTPEEMARMRLNAQITLGAADKEQWSEDDISRQLATSAIRALDIVERVANTKAALEQLYETGKIEGLTQYGAGVASGISQLASWALDPKAWAEPISTIGLPKE